VPGLPKQEHFPRHILPLRGERLDIASLQPSAVFSPF